MSKYTEQARELRHGYPQWFNPDIPDFAMKELVASFSDEAAEEAFKPCQVVTIMGGDAYRNFILDKKYLTFWQTGPTWHTQFSNDPEYARDWNDKRLFGEHAEHTAFALILTHGDGYNLAYGSDGELKKYLDSYAKHGKLIEWTDDVLDGATFTYGDCQQNIMVWDFSPKALMAYAAAVNLAAGMTYDIVMPMFLQELADRMMDKWSEEAVMQCCGAAFLSSGMVRNPYFEIQIHKPLTPEFINRLL